MAGPEHAACAGMQDRGRQHHRENRQRRIGERADADRRRRATPATSRSERAASTSAPPGIWPDQRDEARGREHQADVDLRPFLRGEIDRDERPEAGLHVGDEEDEPVEPAQAARATDARRLARAGSRRRQRERGLRPAAPPQRRRDRSLDRGVMVPGQDTSPASLTLFRQRLELAERAEHDDGLPSLIFRRGLHLVAREFERDPASRLPACGKCSAFQSTAILRLPTPRKPPKSMIAARTWPLAVDEDVDDPAHVLVGGAAHLAAENAFDLVLVEDGDRGRSGGAARTWAAACCGAGTASAAHRPPSAAHGRSDAISAQCAAPHAPFDDYSRMLPPAML